jgi:hypothetical protein
MCTCARSGLRRRRFTSETDVILRKHPLVSAPLYLGAGIFWAVIAWLFGRAAYGREIVWGLAVAPAIGLVIGLTMQQRFEAATSRGRGGIAFLSLLISVASFGLLGGLLSVLLSSEPRGAERIYEYAATALYGTYFTGFFIVFWPLAYFTHFLLARMRDQ